MAIVPFLSGLAGALWRERRASGTELKRLRDERLAAIVRHARATTPLYAERLSHIDPSLPINLAQIEPITKSELMDRFDDSIAHRALSLDEASAFARDSASVDQTIRGFTVATTSGTTGRVGYFVSDARSFALMNGVLFARVLRHRLNPREILRFCFGRRYRMAMVIATGGHFITRLVSGFRPLLTRALVDVRAFSIVAPVEEVVHRLNLYRPHYLHGYPTFLETLAHERRAGRLSIDPEFISLGSEPVSASARLVLTSAFPRAQLSETYGSTECLAMANQCSAGRLHVNDDVCILEPVDHRGRPVPVGVASDKVYLTNLVNRAQPLLRYEVSDSITVLGTDCPCGSPMTSIRVEGRADDTIFLADEDGRFSSHPPVPFEALFLGVRGLAQYQLVHVEQNHLEVRYVLDPGADAQRVEREVASAFGTYLAKRRLLGVVHVKVVRLDALGRSSGHKLRQIYSEVPRPPIAV
ncbi:MAG: phenylacetate--CoA ligase family protein [Deltaproteobacteria bacterium]|nr:phenylacetate--CoA ligase family protein [Deltaproteobacteria bacterium]